MPLSEFKAPHHPLLSRFRRPIPQLGIFKFNQGMFCVLIPVQKLPQFHRWNFRRAPMKSCSTSKWRHHTALPFTILVFFHMITSMANSSVFVSPRIVHRMLHRYVEWRQHDYLLENLSLCSWDYLIYRESCTCNSFVAAHISGWFDTERLIPSVKWNISELMQLQATLLGLCVCCWYFRSLESYYW